jgi:hypothetical protein
MFGILLLIGAGSGMFLDYFLGYRLGWWYYIHHAYYTWDYFMFLIPAWAMMVTLFILFYKLLDYFITNPIIKFTVYFGLIPLQQEFMGISQDSWSYAASPALIGIGWILLLDSCIILKEFIDWLNMSPVEIHYYNQGVQPSEFV